MKKSENTTEKPVTLPTSFRDAITVLKGRKPPDVAVPEADLPWQLPVFEQMEAEEEAAKAEERRKAAEYTKNIRVGDEVPGGDIFAGTWAPVDRQGESLGKTFNLFVQPADISVEVFVDLVARVASLSNGFNHVVAGKRTDEVLYDALRSGTYKGEYFIPPEDVLATLYENKDVGRFSNTFEAQASSGMASRYWSCTEHPHVVSIVSAFRFFSRYVEIDNWHNKNDFRLSGRLVRAELCR